MTTSHHRSSFARLGLVLLAASLLLLGNGCSNFPANASAPLDTSATGK